MNTHNERDIAAMEEWMRRKYDHEFPFVSSKNAALWGIAYGHADEIAKDDCAWKDKAIEQVDKLNEMEDEITSLKAALAEVTRERDDLESLMLCAHGWFSDYFKEEPCGVDWCNKIEEIQRNRKLAATTQKGEYERHNF